MGSIPIARSTWNPGRSLICKRKSQPQRVGFFVVWSISGFRRNSSRLFVRVQQKAKIQRASVSPGRQREAEFLCEMLHAQVAVERFAAQFTDA
ncbi:MAG: hypothetical protein WB476_06085, partial [Azonexus sp.]